MATKTLVSGSADRFGEKDKWSNQGKTGPGEERGSGKEALNKGKIRERETLGERDEKKRARNDVEKDRERDDRVLTSEGQQSPHITQLSWKIDSPRYEQWCQQQKGQATMWLRFSH